MRKSKVFRLFAITFSILALLSVLSGCQKGKEFDSPESMISQMTGTYQGSGEHSGERIVIDGSSVITFNIDHIFPEITDDYFFEENFSKENWNEFDLDDLLGKPYVAISTEPISANVKKSTISGLWINKDGVLFSKDAHPLTKTSSDSIYPTAEMQVKFEEYREYLQKYEKNIIIAEAKSNLSEKKEALDSALASSSGSSYQKSTASAKVIAQCAFESLLDYISYPSTATLDSYTTTPQYDSYGRVATRIAVTYQNIFGNYITEEVYVVLQSCTNSGQYSYSKGGIHYSKNENNVQYLLLANHFEIEPTSDDPKEAEYKDAIRLIKNNVYTQAAKKLEALGDYKSSVKLKEACTSLSEASKYNRAIDLFDQWKYKEAIAELSALLNECNGDYLKAQRVIALCDAAINKPADNNGNTSNGETPSQPPATEPPATQPPVTEPPVTEPPATQPPVTEPPVTEPPATQPPVTEPPATQPPVTEPPATQPPATQPPVTEPPATQPPVTEPPATQPPATCSHNYSAATCTEPQKCTLCGKTNGAPLGHAYRAATCETPKTCANCGATDGNPAGHKWTDITETVHHEEQGHYEDVQDAKKVQKYRCPRCGYNAPTYETQDAYYAHFDSAHGSELNSSFDRERYELVDEWIYETVTEWVVDQEAYTETVVTGRKCNVCGKTE